MHKDDLWEVTKKMMARQKSVCPVCGKSLKGISRNSIVLDHDHKTGVVRAALHRGCNRVEGSVLATAKKWGKAKSMDGVIKVLQNLIDFWTLHRTPQTEFIYYNHKTETEKRVALNKKRRLAAKKKREAK